MSESGANGLVGDYKRLLQAVCDNRPSGTRGRLAAALGTNRSFVTQLVNPSYAMPIPAQHLETIFEVCHFSASEREAFLNAYNRAHPGRHETDRGNARTRIVSVRVPDLGHAHRNRVIENMLTEYARQLVRLVATLED